MFERFTDRARRVMVLAQEEARRLRHDYIGTEHLLLGLLTEGEGLAAKALEGLGISLDAARQQVAKLTSPGAGTTGSPPFTPRAKKVLELSLREALALAHNYIGTEHILLGIVREGEGVGAEALVQLGADLSRVRQQVIQRLSGWGSPEEPPGDPLCPHCGARLEEHAGSRRLMIGDDPDDLHEFLVVYCGMCGRALAFKPGA